MKRTFKIIYEQKWTACPGWIVASTNVVGNADAQKAVDRVRRQTLGLSYKAADSGKQEKCVGFRLREVQLLAQAD